MHANCNVTAHHLCSVLFVFKARIIFGNNLVPSTLVIRLEEAKCTYSTRNASNQTDLFMHHVKCQAENVRVMLTPSQGYSGPADP